jgi:uncharacterized membrane protein YeiH
VFLACLTAVGGGTLRDVVLGRDTVFWVAEPLMIVSATAAAVLVFFTAHRVESRLRTLEWLDAVALAVAVPAGAGLALSMDAPWIIVAIMGVATGTFGGLMRDVVCNEVPLILKKGELYATAALAGVLLALGAAAVGVPSGGALVACGCATFALRAGSMLFGWNLPVYKSRPPRK